MKWIESTGGPLILIPKRIAHQWTGVCGSDTESPSTIDTTSDYDRACQVPEYIGTVPVGDTCGVVFGDEPLRTTWIAADYGGLVIRWYFAESEDDILKGVADCPEDVFDDVLIEFESSGDECILFDSSCDGTSVVELREDCLILDLKGCRYSILTGVYNHDDKTSVLIHKFKEMI